jgi:hypothetical protein
MTFAAGWRCQSGFAHMQLVCGQCAVSGVALHAEAGPVGLQLACGHCAASGVAIACQGRTCRHWKHPERRTACNMVLQPQQHAGSRDAVLPNPGPCEQSRTNADEQCFVSATLCGCGAAYLLVSGIVWSAMMAPSG